MMQVSLDERGRLTLPIDIRNKLNSSRFLVSLEGDSVRIIPVPDPREAKGSIRIPWSIDELEESQEERVLDRDVARC